MKRCLVLVLFLFHALYADEDQDFSLVNLTKSPIPRIAGTVNIITGDWIDQGAHQETSGPDPYIVGHSYVSSGEEKGCLSDSWDFLHPSTLDVYQPKGIFYVYKSPDALLETGQEQLSPQTPFPLEKGSHRPSHHKKEKETGLRDCKEISYMIRLAATNWSVDVRSSPIAML